MGGGETLSFLGSAGPRPAVFDRWSVRSNIHAATFSLWFQVTTVYVCRGPARMPGPGAADFITTPALSRWWDRQKARPTVFLVITNNWKFRKKAAQRALGVLTRRHELSVHLKLKILTPTAALTQNSGPSPPSRSRLKEGKTCRLSPAGEGWPV